MPKIAEQIVWQDVEGELALFDLRGEKYHGLNPIASEIWRSIARGLSADEIVDALAVRYDASRETVTCDVENFIADALSAGLLVEVDSPS